MKVRNRHPPTRHSLAISGVSLYRICNGARRKCCLQIRDERDADIRSMARMASLDPDAFIPIYLADITVDRSLASSVGLGRSVTQPTISGQTQRSAHLLNTRPALAISS